jgi:Ca-activated chloride channel family protein
MERIMTRTLRLGFALAAFLALPAYAAEPSPEILEDLAPRFRDWLAQVEMLITEEERAYFLGLEEDFHRAAYITAFWAARDNYDDTRFNEFQVHYEERVGSAVVNWGSLEDARAQTYVAQGEPFDRCFHPTREVEVWIYDEAPEDKKLGSYDDLFPVLLFRPGWKDHYLRWLPLAAEAKLNESAAMPIQFMPVQRPRLPDVPIIQWCDDADVSVAMKRITARANDWGTADPKTAYTIEIPEPSKEWLPAFHAQTTILPEGAATFPARLAFEFPGRHQQRTVVQGVIELDRAELAAFGGESETADLRHHQLLLLGEVVRGDELFERFRYRFEVPVTGGVDEPLAVVFQRYWRPGPFRVLLKLEDLFGRRFAHLDRTLEVPDVADRAPAELLAALREESQLYRALAEADAATARGERSLRLLAPAGVVVTGMVRFQTVTVGEFDRVEFLLDERPILAKKTPPYSVELDLGNVPSAHRLRASGYGPGGEILATDEVLLNPGGQRFRVSLTEPQQGRKYRDSLRAAVQVAVPDGEELDRVELFLNETRVATLFQPPFVQPILLGGEELAYVRAVGYLKDGNSSEDLVFVNAPGEIDEIDVHFVELYAAVYDRQGRFLPGLTEADFKVLEDGEAQTARRFEQVEDLPLHVALAIDVSASMEDSIGSVAQAARTFVEEVVEPRDRATLVAFNHQPHVRARFTNDVAALARELEALRSAGGTALYDSLAFTLHYFHGIRGQKALLLLSDGEDETSSFALEDALEFARRAGVQIYVIGLKEAVTKHGARKVLSQFADETGGRAYFVADLGELPGIYAEIQRELRSQYLFAYQSTSRKDPSQFRAVKVLVEVDGKKADVRAMSGYYP